MPRRPAATCVGSARPLIVRCVATSLTLLALVAATLAIRAYRTSSASEWPRPYDPAKPFNMLGVPGVSTEQRERAEDLLLRSLTEAPRWSDYQQVRAAGWFSIETPRPGGFEHLINPDMVDDDHMLDPLYPESLVYKVNDGKRTFVAYMFMARPWMAPDDPRLLDFAGRLIEWHVHRDVCITPAEGNPLGNVAGFVQADGTCAIEEATPRTIDGLELAMTHVWVVARDCGPFSTLAGFAEGETPTPRDERVDLCRH